jgi:hypothetical protein
VQIVCPAVPAIVPVNVKTTLPSKVVGAVGDAAYVF